MPLCLPWLTSTDWMYSVRRARCLLPPPPARPAHAHAHHPVFLHHHRRPSTPISFTSHLNASAASPHAKTAHVILFAVLSWAKNSLEPLYFKTQSSSAWESREVIDCLVDGHDGPQTWCTHVAFPPHHAAPVHAPPRRLPTCSPASPRTLSASRHPTCQVQPLAAPPLLPKLGAAHDAHRARPAHPQGHLFIRPLIISWRAHRPILPG